MRYNIEGEPLPVLICELQENESMISESGAMSWMSPNMNMETNARGGLGKAFGRAFSGESMFQNTYTAMQGPGMIAFASSFPGTIMPFMVGPDSELIVQKKAFLCSELGVETSVHFQKKFTSGLFGGEGFIMQRIHGQGLAFLEIDGNLKTYDLAPGQEIVIDTGYLAAMSASCDMEIVSNKGLKNKLFGGEGFFNTLVIGPGRVYIQTMPISKLAGMFYTGE